MTELEHIRQTWQTFYNHLNRKKNAVWRTAVRAFLGVIDLEKELLEVRVESLRRDNEVYLSSMSALAKITEMLDNRFAITATRQDTERIAREEIAAIIKQGVKKLKQKKLRHLVRSAMKAPRGVYG